MSNGVVAKVLAELEAALGSDADVSIAEFLVSLADGAADVGVFVAKLEENGAPFEAEFVAKIFAIIKSFKSSEDASGLKRLAEDQAPARKYLKQEAEEDGEVDEYGRSVVRRARYDYYDGKRSEYHEERKPERNHGYNNVTTASAPTAGKIYKGKVKNIKDFGAFIRLDGFARGKYFDGLCHISELANVRIDRVEDIVNVGEVVFVKVLAIEGNRIKLSMKNIDQGSGQELAPVSRDLRFSGQRPKKKLTSPERWELRQLISSGAISKVDHPELEEELQEYNEDLNLEPEEDINIEIKQDLPPFLKGKAETVDGDVALDTLKIIKKPDGSLNRAAMNGSELARNMKEKKLKEMKEKRLKAIQDKKKAQADPLAAASLEPEEVSGFQKSQGKNISYGKRAQLPMEEQRKGLPVYKLREKFLEMVRENQFLVVVGETGSGKTTQLTQYLMEDGYADRKMVGCTQPRRVAAVSVAKRVAEEVGCALGDTVGYTIRFEEKASSRTRIKYMTDGMLEKEALSDINMLRYSVILLDEAHERTVATDVLFGLLKKTARQRPDLKILVTSATLDSQKFSRYFDDCPVLKIPGRTFPVDIMYTKAPEYDYLAASLDTVLQIHVSEPPGDILVFLTGQEEIDTACEALFERTKLLGKSIADLIILPVYSSLPSEVQSRIFEPTPKGSRKCVIATNIAETSITIDGIFYVVDPGFVKINAYDAKLGMDSLIVSPISQAQANQRAGRAGRTGPGKCYRLYTENAFNNELQSNSVPEIQRLNLSNTILTLKAIGIEDMLKFEFMDPPPTKTMLVALEDLYNLSALDKQGHLTKLGRKMADFPMDPSLAKSLITSVDLKCSDDLITIVAMLSVPSVFYRPKNKQQQADLKKLKFNSVSGDHVTLLNTFNKWVQNDYSKRWCEENYIQERGLRRAKDVRGQLIKIMMKYKHPIVSCGRDYDRIRVALCDGFFKNSAKRDHQESGAYKTLIEDTPVFMHPSSALFGKRSEYVIYHTLVLTSREYMHCATTIDAKWLIEAAPTFFKVGEPGTKKSSKIVSMYKKREL